MENMNSLHHNRVFKETKQQMTNNNGFASKKRVLCALGPNTEADREEAVAMSTMGWARSRRQKPSLVP